MQKAENYLRAFGQLAQAIEIYSEHPDNTLYRDGLIQRFEFTVELAWKSLKEHMEDQGYSVEYSSPKAVVKEAYAAGYIHDSQVWVEILNARNLTSHIYKEETAIEIAQKICRQFLPVFRSLAELYQLGT